jgi:arginine N-succinyltransferase
MIIVRPIRGEDLDRLLELAKSVAGGGMTTLPTERAALDASISSSLQNFASDIENPGPEYYLLVLEDSETGAVGGTAAVFARIGIEKPFYSYKLTKTTHVSTELGIQNTHDVLHLVNDYIGFSEVGSLYLAPEFRRDGNGKTLARSRYLLMAEHRNRFPKRVVAEMRGWQDENGVSPFWEHVGKPFFNMDFHEADHLSGIGNNQFIADLMPKYPIYVDLLPREARDVIGMTHEDTRPALAMLEKEGFRFERHVDIFDGGPCVQTWVDDILTVRDSRISTVARIFKDSQAPKGARLDIVCAGHTSDFRVCRGLIQIDDNGDVELCDSAAQALQLDIGGTIRHIAM